MNSYPRVGVGVHVLEDDHILLGRRIASHGSDTWCPPGGHLEWGETPQACAARELEEETGLVATHVELGPWTNDFFKEEQKHYITLHTFVIDFVGELTVKEPDKCSEWRWFSLDHLPSPLFLPLANYLSSLTRKAQIR